VKNPEVTVILILKNFEQECARTIKKILAMDDHWPANVQYFYYNRMKQTPLSTGGQPGDL
jgi:hypothetical protein